jgi:hypothetical protein
MTSAVEKFSKEDTKENLSPQVKQMKTVKESTEFKKPPMAPVY